MRPSETKATHSPWFVNKTRGICWTVPVTWQGWLTLVLYVLLMAVGDWFFYFSTLFSLAELTLYFLVVSTFFITLCWLKGERKGWPWKHHEDSAAKQPGSP